MAINTRASEGRSLSDMPIQYSRAKSPGRRVTDAGPAVHNLGAKEPRSTLDDIASYARTHTATGFVEQYIFSMGPAIAGGATNIQLNIIGERGLGLPRDLRQSE